MAPSLKVERPRGRLDDHAVQARLSGVPLRHRHRPHQPAHRHDERHLPEDPGKWEFMYTQYGL